MKKIFILHYSYVLLITLIFTGCNRCEDGSGNVISMTRNVPSFSSVKILGSFFVTVKKDSISKIEVITDDNIQPYVLTYVNGNTLTVETNYRKCVKKSTIMRINISVPLYEKIELRGSGNIAGIDTIEGDHMQISLEGSGNIRMILKANNLNADIDGSGHMELYGTSNTMTESVDGSGFIEAFGLSTNTANAHVSGSGLIQIHVVNSLNATVEGSGNITYTGNPLVNSSVDGSGYIGHQ
jgi:hypothetical protein